MMIKCKITSTVLLVTVMVLGSGAIGSAGIDGFEVRSIDGTGNNIDYPEYGSAGEVLLRFSDVGYTQMVYRSRRANTHA